MLGSLRRREEAEAVYGPEVMEAYKYYWHARNPNFVKFESEADFNLTNVAKDRIVIGEPEECIQDFLRWKEVTGADNFILRLRPRPLRRSAPRKDNGSAQALWRASAPILRIGCCTANNPLAFDGRGLG